MITAYNIIIFPVIFLFLNTSPQLKSTEDFEELQNRFHQIYFIKQNWHTAIVLKTAELKADNLFIEYNTFREYGLIDIGWGDEEFYQIPGFDSGLAFRALFYNTPSTLRVEGISITMPEYFKLSEVVIELQVSDEQFRKICEYINHSFKLDSDGKTQVLSRRGGGKIVFYKARGNYHLLNTCNTWLARGIQYSGIDIEDNIILTEQLFNELSEIGNVIKADY